MGLPELLSALRKEAEHELTELDQHTRDEVSAVLADADRHVDALLTRALERAETAAAAEARLKLSIVRLEAQRDFRHAREAAFSALLDEVRERLARLRDDPGYRELLAELVHEALVALPSGRVLFVDSRDAGLAADALRALGRDDVELRPELTTWGGAQLASEDGRRVQNTLEERFANSEPLLRTLLAQAGREEGG